MKSSLDKLTVQIESLKKVLPEQDIYVQQVSKASVYWHIQHSLLTIEKILQSLEESNPELYTSSFKLGKLFVFRAGIIPRGRAESPQVVQPTERYTYEQIQQEIQKIQTLLPLFSQLAVCAYFEHPFLGKLKTDEAIKFLVIHTHHHIKIIKDITQTN